MPPRLMKPTDVPAPRQPFVDMLWRFHAAAGLPPMRRIAETIEALDEEQRKGTANPETIRRAMRGETVGAWETAEVIFLALCELADVDPHDTEGDEGDQWNPPIAHLDEFRRRWYEAVGGERMPDLPRTRAERDQQIAAEAAYAAARQAAQDAWSKNPQTEEPPF